MSRNKLTPQQELMKKLLDEKKNNNSQGNSKVLRPERGNVKTSYRSKQERNGGGMFDK